MVGTGIEQWSLRVHRREGEAKRRALMEQGLLDRSLRIRAEGDLLVFPVIAPLEGCSREEFEPLPAMQELPRHELIGGIAIMQERDPGAAARILASRPSLHTVLYPLGPVDGEHRTRRFEVLAGKRTTATVCTEYGRSYRIDLSRAYFSPRLAEERQRLLKVIRDGETVLDMFAGVGPIAITLSAKAEVVFACDINPAAVELMIENIARNRARNVVPILADASRLHLILPLEFDRIVMNLPMNSLAYLDVARALCRKGGTIHLYALESVKGEHAPVLVKHGLEMKSEREVHSYSPERWLAAYELLCLRAD